MRHQKSGRKLSRRKEHRKALLSNLAISLIEYGRIKTTSAKAKEMRPFVERMVTFARRGDLHARRIVLSRLGNATAVKKLFDEIGPQFVDRSGGYTRILKLGFRPGDNSPMSLIEFVAEEVDKKPAKKKPSKSKDKPVKAAVKEEKSAAEGVEEQPEEVEAAAEVSPESVEAPVEKPEAAVTETAAPAAQETAETGAEDDTSARPEAEKEDEKAAPAAQEEVAAEETGAHKAEATTGEASDEPAPETNGDPAESEK